MFCRKILIMLASLPMLLACYRLVLLCSALATRLFPSVLIFQAGFHLACKSSCFWSLWKAASVCPTVILFSGLWGLVCVDRLPMPSTNLMEYLTKRRLSNCSMSLLSYYFLCHFLFCLTFLSAMHFWLLYYPHFS